MGATALLRITNDRAVRRAMIVDGWNIHSHTWHLQYEEELPNILTACNSILFNLNKCWKQQCTITGNSFLLGSVWIWKETKTHYDLYFVKYDEIKTRV